MRGEGGEKKEMGHGAGGNGRGWETGNPLYTSAFLKEKTKEKRRERNLRPPGH